MKRRTAGLFAAVALLGLVAGCGSVPTGSVTGNVSRIIACGQSGVGSLYVGFLDSRPDESDGVTMLAFAHVPEADYSQEGSSYEYAIDGVVVGTEGWLSAFLDENGNADPLQPWPDLGDLISFPPVAVVVVLEGTEVNLVFEAVCPGELGGGSEET